MKSRAELRAVIHDALERLTQQATLEEATDIVTRAVTRAITNVRARHEDARVEHARNLTIEEHGSPALKARDAGDVVLAAVTHDFAPGLLVRKVETIAPGLVGEVVAPDPKRCRTCARREDHPCHVTPAAEPTRRGLDALIPPPSDA